MDTPQSQNQAIGNNRVITKHTKPCTVRDSDSTTMKARGNRTQKWLNFLEEEGINMEPPPQAHTNNQIKVRSSQVVREEPMKTERVPRGDCRVWKEFLDNGQLPDQDRGDGNIRSRGQVSEVKVETRDEGKYQRQDKITNQIYNIGVDNNGTRHISRLPNRVATPYTTPFASEDRQSPRSSQIREEETEKKESLFLSKSSKGKEMWRISRSGSGTDQVFKVVRTDRTGNKDPDMIGSLAHRYSSIVSRQTDRMKQSYNDMVDFEALNDRLSNKCSHNVVDAEDSISKLTISSKETADKVSLTPLASEDVRQDTRCAGRRTRAEILQQKRQSKDDNSSALTENMHPVDINNFRGVQQEKTIDKKSRSSASSQIDFQDDTSGSLNDFGDVKSTESLLKPLKIQDKSLRLIDHLERSESIQEKAPSQFKATGSKDWRGTSIGRMCEKKYPDITAMLADSNREYGVQEFTFRPISPLSAQSSSISSSGYDNNYNAQTSNTQQDRGHHRQNDVRHKANPDIDVFSSPSRSTVSNTTTLRDSGCQYSPPPSCADENDTPPKVNQPRIYESQSRKFRYSDCLSDMVRSKVNPAHLSTDIYKTETGESFNTKISQLEKCIRRIKSVDRNKQERTESGSDSEEVDKNMSCCHGSQSLSSSKPGSVKSMKQENNSNPNPNPNPNQVSTFGSEENVNRSNSTTTQSRKLGFTTHRESSNDAPTYRVEPLNAIRGKDVDQALSDVTSNFPMTMNQLHKIIQETKEDSHTPNGVANFSKDQNQNSDFSVLNSIDRDMENSSPYIGQFLHRLWRTQCFCDVKVQVGDQCFLAHKLVLAAFSDVFYPTTPQPPPSVCFSIPNSTPEAVFQVFKYLYTSSMDLRDDLLEPVMAAAIFMGITEIQEVVKDILQRPTVENVAMYVKTANKIGMPVSIVDFPKLIRDHFKELGSSQDFLELPPDEVERLLADPEVMVDSELDTVEVLSNWLQFNILERNKYVGRLLKYINFEAISPTSIASLQADYPHLFCTPEGIDVITSAFKYHALKHIPGTENLWFQDKQLILGFTADEKEKKAFSIARKNAMDHYREVEDHHHRAYPPYFKKGTIIHRRGNLNHSANSGRKTFPLDEEDPDQMNQTGSSAVSPENLSLADLDSSVDSYDDVKLSDHTKHQRRTALVDRKNTTRNSRLSIYGTSSDESDESPPRQGRSRSHGKRRARSMSPFKQNRSRHFNKNCNNRGSLRRSSPILHGERTSDHKSLLPSTNTNNSRGQYSESNQSLNITELQKNQNSTPKKSTNLKKTNDGRLPNNYQNQNTAKQICTGLVSQNRPELKPSLRDSQREFSLITPIRGLIDENKSRETLHIRFPTDIRSGLFGQSSVPKYSRLPQSDELSTSEDFSSPENKTNHSYQERLGHNEKNSAFKHWIRQHGQSSEPRFRKKRRDCCFDRFLDSSVHRDAKDLNINNSHSKKEGDSLTGGENVHSTLFTDVFKGSRIRATVRDLRSMYLSSVRADDHSGGRTESCYKDSKSTTNHDDHQGDKTTDTDLLPVAALKDIQPSTSGVPKHDDLDISVNETQGEDVIGCLNNEASKMDIMTLKPKPSARISPFN